MRTQAFSVLAAALVCLGAATGNGTVIATDRGDASSAAALSSVVPDSRIVNRPVQGAGERATVQHRSVSTAAAQRAGVSPEVLNLALQAVGCAVSSGRIAAPPTLTLIDYSRPSVEPRLWVFDLSDGRLLFKELVAHGRNTGENMAVRFSNAAESRESSLGLFVTDEPYVGDNGYSLRLDGLEPGFNDNARARAIVMHGAPYVEAAFAAAQGRIGRSWGCPALRPAVARQVIDRIRGGGVIFSYYPDQNWLQHSRFLNGCGGAPGTLATN